MSLAAKLLSASGGASKLYVDDVFSAYTYTGNGSTQTINNGIDLAGKGGLVISKGRNTTGTDWCFNDSANGGFLNRLSSNNINATAVGFSTTMEGVTSVSTSGHVFKSFYNSSTTYVSWTFRKAPKFFDVVTYTGNGVAGRQIPHALGIAPGMIIVKRTDLSAGWMVYHRSITASSYLELQSTNQAYAGGDFNSTEPTSSVFTVGATVATNASGGTYVAYLFAHDSSADGIVQCGSVANGTNVNLGWEPQFVLYRRSDAASSWFIADVSRGWTANGAIQFLNPNASSAEATGSSVTINSTGFNVSALGGTIIYLAIRRSNKPPTTGTQVYNAIARTGTGAAATVTGVGFAPDLEVLQSRTTGTYPGFLDRLRGGDKFITTAYTDPEYGNFGRVFGVDGIGMSATANDPGVNYINHFFKRAPGVFDVVCYTGTGVARTVAHGLGVVPELVIIKSRSVSTQWIISGSVLPSSTASYMYLNSTAAVASLANIWTTPTASTFGFGSANPTDSSINGSGGTYVAYLFATKAGISKVGSYTGNGTSQTIDCGFTTGARFVMIKRTDSTGDWYIWDTVRGLVAGNDPHLSLNTTAAEVTSNDSLDPANAGFIVNQLAATNINVTGASYIYLSLA